MLFLTQDAVNIGKSFFSKDRSDIGVVLILLQKIHLFKLLKSDPIISLLIVKLFIQNL